MLRLLIECRQLLVQKSYFPIDYAEGIVGYAFTHHLLFRFLNNSGVATGHSADAAYTPESVKDWYDEQTLGLTNATVIGRQ